MDRAASALLTDLYQLTMAQGYVQAGMAEPASFELSVRALPARRGFLVAAGLEQALAFLGSFGFPEPALARLAASQRFDPGFLSYLAALRFTGDVDAMPEGTVCFADEPILRVTAPLPQAQLVETRLINLLQLQTTIAAKAARSVLVAPGKLLVDFGLRRAHGAEAGLYSARAAYLAGFDGTSNLLAGLEYDIPLYGTMAHSFVEAYARERDAFEGFARAQREGAVLLIDTYDTERGAEQVAELLPRLAQGGIAIHGVRIDSGDLGAHARKVRRILDRAGFREVRIFASGGLDEDRLLALARAGAPIDGFGVGTHLCTSADAPYLDCAYKLVEYAGRPRAKRSEGKATLPGRKQVYRWQDERGFTGDVVTLDGDLEAGQPLLQPVMRGGKSLLPPRPLAEIRRYVGEQLARLPEPLRRLEAYPYPVRIASPLRDLAASLAATGATGAPATRREAGAEDADLPSA
jgi:nicotinate phosphoribosyltransferase